MEERRKDGSFFLSSAYKKVNTIFELARKRHPELFEGSRENKTATFEKRFSDNIQQSLDKSEATTLNMMKWLPASININMISYFDYLFYLSQMLKEANTSKAHLKKMGFGGN